MQHYYTTIDISESEKWNRALKNVPHAFAHTADHCRSVQIDSGYRTFLFLFEKDGVKICCPLVERDFNGSIDIAKPFGISGFTGNGTHPDFYNTWLEFISNKGYLTCYSGIHPRFGKIEWFPKKSVYPHQSIQLLDIEPDVETILANMSKKRRQQFNNWNKTLDNLTVNRNDIVTFFLDHYHAFLDRKEAASYYYFSNKAMKAFINTEKTIAVGAIVNGELVSATLFGYTKYLADAIFNLSLPGKNYYSAELIWYAVLELKKRGVPLLNMGGGGRGISDFKRRFGAYQLELFSLKEVYDDSEYMRLTDQSLESGQRHNGFFPAYRRQINL